MLSNIGKHLSSLENISFTIIAEFITRKIPFTNTTDVCVDAVSIFVRFNDFKNFVTKSFNF